MGIVATTLFPVREGVKLTARHAAADCEVMRTRRAALLIMLMVLGCDEGLTPRPTPATCPSGFVGICGTVTFRGAVPDSTDAVYVVAYATFPTTQDDLFLFLPVPPPALPLDSAGT